MAEVSSNLSFSTQHIHPATKPPAKEVNMSRVPHPSVLAQIGAELNFSANCTYIASVTEEKSEQHQYLVAKLSPSPSEPGLSKLYNHGGTATARASESTLLDFVGS